MSVSSHPIPIKASVPISSFLRYSIILVAIIDAFPVFGRKCKTYFVSVSAIGVICFSSHFCCNIDYLSSCYFSCYSLVHQNQGLNFSVHQWFIQTLSQFLSPSSQLAFVYYIWFLLRDNNSKFLQCIWYNCCSGRIRNSKPVTSFY